MAGGWDGWSDSADAWIKSVENGGDWTRRNVLDGPMRMLCLPKPGDRWLDLGCGEGRFTRFLAEAGAFAVGLDPIQRMLEHAQRLGGGAFVVGNGEHLPFRDATFDGVAAYLSLIDIPDFRAAIRDVARVLKPGGRFVIANLSAFATSVPNPRIRDAEGNILHMAVDNYLDERAEWVEWSGIRVRNWHRPLASYMSALLDTGLELRHFSEPAADASATGASDYNRAPWGLIMVWERPDGSPTTNR